MLAFKINVASIIEQLLLLTLSNNKLKYKHSLHVSRLILAFHVHVTITFVNDLIYNIKKLY